MAKLIRWGLFATLAAYASAKCDNQCSGHGTCMTDDVCQCYDNFGSGLSHDSGDCSDRICPFEVAWVDHPDNQGHYHKYMECAGKGICDRSTGECQCFEGYEGKGCQRAACPNDCSGHGRCEYIEDLPYGATWNDWVDSNSANTKMQTRTQSLFSDDAKTFDYHLWDKSKSRKCVCDATYGDLDCSKRLCPYGTDVLDTKDDTYYGLEGQKYQEQTILLSSLSTDTFDLNGKSFALTFTSRLNETFTTVPIALSSSSEYIDLQNDIKLALLKLPNGVIDGVKVTVDYIDQQELYKLVSDSLFPAATLVATTIQINNVDKLGVSSGIATSQLSGSIASGCVLGGNIVRYAAHTTITTFGLINGTQLTAAAASAYDSADAVAYDITCFDGNTTIVSAGTDLSSSTPTTTTIADDDIISIPQCGIKSAKVSNMQAGSSSIFTISETPQMYGLSSLSGNSIYKLANKCKLADGTEVPIGLKADSGAKEVTKLILGAEISEECEVDTGIKLDSYAAFFPYTWNAINGGDVNGTATCTMGSSKITTSANPGYSYVSIPECGISSAKVTAIDNLNITLDTEATISQTAASVYVLGHTCTLNGQIIARMAMSASSGSFSASKLIIGYGGIVPGCTIADDTGNSLSGDLKFQSFAGDFAFLNQDIGSNHTSESSAQTFTCAQSYLPGTHQFTTTSGITRGQVYDQSGNYIGGHDQAVLPGIDEQNHRRLGAHTGLLTIKIGFTGPSVQGPQHLLTVEDYQCGAGCTPKLKGMPLETRKTASYWSTIVELTKSDFNSYECGRRGKCDYSTGLCQCFAGYVGDNCNTLTTLV